MAVEHCKTLFKKKIIIINFPVSQVNRLAKQGGFSALGPKTQRPKTYSHAAQDPRIGKQKSSLENEHILDNEHNMRNKYI